MSVFISWSGKRSKELALLLRNWLPNVLQGLDVWMSDSDIDAGTRSMTEISEHLKTAKIGIICVTPENQTYAPWLLFEAGAISKTVSDAARVCPYLLNLQANQLVGPLAQFQSAST